MKKNILLTVVLVFSVIVNAQNAIQEFNFNSTLSNTSNTVSFFGVANYVKDRTGVVNGALRVVNNVLEVSIPNIPLSNSQRTVSIWVKYNDVTTANYIWGYGTLTNAQYFGLLQQSATNSYSDLNLASWGPTNDIIVSTTITTGTWYNYTVTYDGLTSRIYRDGELIKSSISPRKLTSSLIFVIGKIGSAVSMNADIDDLKIYDVALSKEEVATIYTKGSAVVSNNEIVTATVAKVVPKKDNVKTATVAKTNIALSTPLEIMPPKMSEIYSSEGLKVLSADKSEIDITSLPEGNYLLKVSNLQNGSNTKKLTVNN